MPNTQLDKLKKNVESQVDDLKNIDTLKAVCGYKPKVPANFYTKEIEDVVISEDLGDEDFVVAMVLGAMFEKDRINKFQTDAKQLFKDNQESMRWDYIIMNVIPGDGNRSLNQNRELIEARKDAIKALTAYKNGDDSLVKKYAQNMIDYACAYGYMRPVNNSVEGNSFYSFFKLLDKEKKTPVFENLKYSENASLILSERAMVGKIMEEAIGYEKKLVEALPEADSEERVLAVNSIMTSIVLSNLQNSYNYDASLAITAMAQQLSNGKAFKESVEYKSIREQYSDEDKKIADKVAARTWTVQVNSRAEMKRQELLSSVPSYQTFMLADNERAVEYINSLIDIFEKTDIYKKLISEADPEKFAESLNELMKNGTGALSITEDVVEDGVVTKKTTSFSTELITPLDKYNNQLQTFKDQFDSELNNMTASITGDVKEIISKAIDSEVKNQREIIEAARNGENVKEIIQQHIKDFRRKPIDVEQIYSAKGFLLSGTDVYDRIMAGEAVYAMRKDKSGFIKVEADTIVGNRPYVKSSNASVIPLGEIASGTVNYAMETNSILLAGRKKPDYGNYSCEVIEKFAICIDIYEKAMANAQPSEQLSEMVASMKDLYSRVSKQYEHYTPELVRGIDKEYDTSKQEFDGIMDAYAKTGESIKAYLAVVKEDKFASDIQKMIDADIKSIGDIKYDNEVMPFAKIFYDKSTNALETQNRFEVSEQVLTGKLSEVNSYILSAKTNQIISEKLGLIKQPDGVFKRDEGAYFTAEHGKLDGFKLADKFADIEDEIRKLFSDSLITQDKFYGNYNADVVVRNILSYNPDYQLSGEEDRKLRKANSEKLYKNHMKMIVDKAVETLLCGNDKKIDRGIKAVIEYPADEAQRRENRELIELSTSNNPAELKKAYEMALEKLMSIDVNNFDPANEKLLYDNTAKVIRNAYIMFDAKKIVEGAQNAGIDFTNPKYEDLRKNLASYVEVGKTWISKLEFMENPISEIMDYKQLSAINQDKLAELYAISMTGDKAASEYLREVLSYKEDSWNEDPSVGMDQKIAEVRRITPAFSELDKEDKTFCKLRSSLNENVRKGIWGRKIDNSRSYNNVIKAIDALRDCDLSYKYTKCSELMTICKRYLTDTTKNTSNSRYKLIKETYNKAQESKEYYRTLSQRSIKWQAKEIVATMSNEWKAIGEKLPKYKQAAEDMVNKLTMFMDDDEFITRLAKTKTCQNIAFKKIDVKDPADYKKAVSEVFDEISRKTPDLAYLSVKSMDGINM